MKICFMGTPEFSLFSLKALIENNYAIDTIYTKAPQKKGRGNRLTKSEIHVFAEHLGIRCITPKSLKDTQVQQNFIDENFDLCIVSSYGLILPKAILDSPKYGCINIHASLLPRLRGASPIQMSIINSDNKKNSNTGITIMQMDSGMDTGNILLQESISIKSDTNFKNLHDDLGKLGAKLIIKTLNLLASHKLQPIKQDNLIATYTKILKKEDGKVNFGDNAQIIEKKVRAFNPYPATYFYYKKELIKVIKAKPLEAKILDNYQIGEIISLNPLHIMCNNSILEIVDLQRQGKKVLFAQDFLRGFKMELGDIIQ